MLSTRSLAEEWMDADDLDPAIYTAVMHDLAQVNSVTLARHPTLSFLSRILKGQSQVRVLDVGFGDGDMLRAIARWTAKRGISADLTGIDLNPRSAPAARAATADSLEINWLTGDYQDLAGQGFDIIISSLVAHHMTHEQLISFLQFMDREAKRGWFINDLHRHGIAWTGFPLLAWVMRWHKMVRHDGQLSIARSYRPDEWQPILAEAGITGARVARTFPFRLCVAKRL
jgi:2-polyprenyl-3-methyl-5-hydroxy-6-metoxy-1,4-benzoquinol methylase